MDISVVIPTYCRAPILSRCLEALRAQDYQFDSFEVIVVDDGSTDETPQLLRDEEKKFNARGISFSHFTQHNSGQGAARNFGIAHARGKIIVLIGDDIFPVTSFLKEHFDFHKRFRDQKDAVLGFIAWHPELEVTPLMHFMTRGGALFGRFGGHQFAFDRLEGKTMADYRFFYTSNISLKREMLMRHPFDPWFSSYGWEDIELGYRITKEEGLTLHYNPAALAYHYHPMSDEDFARRMRRIGESVHAIQKKYPELHMMPPAWKQNIFRLIGSVPVSVIARLFSRDFYHYALSKRYFMEGLQSRVCVLRPT